MVGSKNLLVELLRSHKQKSGRMTTKTVRLTPTLQEEFFTYSRVRLIQALLLLWGFILYHLLETLILTQEEQRGTKV
jgi:hypothetical protein